jgi:hypothetical protein
VIFKDTLPDRFFLCLCVQARPIVAQLSSTTYYVSSSLGDDGNNGLSPHSPLASIARVNALSLLPGDRVSQVYDLFFTPGGALKLFTAVTTPGRRFAARYPSIGYIIKE